MSKISFAPYHCQRRRAADGSRRPHPSGRFRPNDFGRLDRESTTNSWREGSVVELSRDRADRPWRARRREILERIVRETEPPTDSLPRLTDAKRTELDEAYNARVGEVLDLAGR